MIYVKTVLEVEVVGPASGKVLNTVPLVSMDETKRGRFLKWAKRKSKKRKDHNHGKRGWVSGNPRYNRHRKNPAYKDKTMGDN